MCGSIGRCAGFCGCLMGGLLLQGLGSLAFRLLPALPANSPLVVRGIFGIDFWHAWIQNLCGAWRAWWCCASIVRASR